MGALTRIRDVVATSLWEEDEAYKRRRRCRMLITTPFAALAGLTWGVFAAPAMGAGSALLWGALGSASFPLLVYLEQRVLPGMTELARRLGLGSGGGAGLVWEIGVVGGLAYMFGSVFALPTVPAAGTALAIGAFYAFVMEYVLCGGAAADVLRLIKGGSAGGAPRRGGLSLAAALSQRGDHAGAIEAYEEAIAARPRDPSPYAHAARAYLADGDDHGAIDVLRRGTLNATAGPDQIAFLYRRIHEIYVRRLRDPDGTVEDLRRLLDTLPEGPHTEWARQEILDISEGVYDE